VMSDFWHGKRVCVTGGNGFLGKHVVAELARKECMHAFVPRSRDFDLTTESGVARMYDERRFDIVIHLAAVCGGIGANQARPGKFFRDNAVMGVNLMHAALEHGVKKFVQIGTVCSYPKHCPTPFREEDLWNGYPEETNAPYGLAKKSLLVMAQAYRAEYGLNAVYLVPVNLYGPGDNFDLDTSHVIPAMIRKCVEAVRKNERVVELWGSGAPSREFLYVEDAAEAIVLAARGYDGSEPMNLGTGREVTMRDLAGLVAKATGFGGSFYWNRSKPDGQPRRCLDTSRAMNALGWKAKTNLEDGIRKTVEWYRCRHR
jgi:GDP-L-fucose synthase